MDKKYQIFISSTYIDLKEERNQIVKTVLRMGHLPVGMEMFDAADESQWETIKRHIDNSDYYLLIIAHRYGSEDADGVGFTEKEYNYALEQGIPCLAFILDGSVKNWNNDYVDSGKKKTKLNTFKGRFKNRLVNFWTSTDNLVLQAALSLSTLTTNKPRIGWIRANEATTSPLVAEEISRLSKENNELKLLVAASNPANDKVQQAYNILEGIPYEFNFFDQKYTGTYLSLFHDIRRILVSGTYIHMLYMDIFALLTKREMFEINHQPDKNVSKKNSSVCKDFADRLTVLLLVEQVHNNDSQSAALILTDKGKDLILRIEHPY
ncbi:DUF4062 domain-containing protein [Hymenobacter chitinivorans]|uniref:Uncharacterized protein DUF4062 n=1 Tax=Hymenobacter chitinivorans DSM 11115 TaxID=1121954 RepID=A0A2M9BND3_9BACT|nr:DUF4062 domain-containing protein [Hymenobacter chitinivorans]PJJ59410.1 uncharacterized protein DUF4062 [Hymenobacter chitinivorans DSM 11115]